MLVTKNEILDILSRVKDSSTAREISVKLDNSNGVRFLLCVKQTEGGIEANIFANGNELTVSGNGSLEWLTEAIYSSIEW